MTSQILAGLNPPQQAAVQAIDGPVLIFAGAGSGKTRVLTHRIAYMIHKHNILPSSILAVTFTNKAAGELRQRVNNMVGQGVGYVNVGTFHSICSRILRAEASSIGYNQNFTIYDDSDGQRVVKDILNTMQLSTDYYKPAGVFYQIKAAKNKMQTPSEMAELAMSARDEKIAEIYLSYESTLKANNAMDFDDLLSKPLEVFENNPAILRFYQNKFKYILVDEYQDTNLAQFKFVEYLSKESKNICVVGDDDQSIYGWRGADISNIIDFQQIFPTGQVFKLEQNYRSTETIIKAANAVVSKNVYRADKVLWTESGKGAPITVLHGETETGEGQAILHAIHDQRNNGIELSSMAVLYRTNAQSRALEDVMRRNAVPYQIVGGTKFYDRKEIKDILAYFRLILNPADSVALLRIINVPSRKIGKTTVERLVKFALSKDKQLYSILNNIDEIGLNSGVEKRINDFYQFIQKYIDLISELSLYHWAIAIIDELGFIESFRAEDTPDAISRIDNINELLAALDEYEKNNENATLAQYMEEVSLLSDIDQFNDEAHKVTLMTLHAAKGLEFDIVFLAGMEQGLFPLERGDSTEDMEEERRLFYVGLTRAKRVAYLTYAMRRTRFGEFMINTPSIFIGEIPFEYLNFPQKEKVGSNRSEKKMSSTKRHKTKPQVRTFAKKSKSLFGEPEVKPKSGEYEIGQEVMHAFFGKGTIINVSGGGPEARLTVVFTGSTKKLVAKFANLKILD